MGQTNILSCGKAMILKITQYFIGLSYKSRGYILDHSMQQ